MTVPTTSPVFEVSAAKIVGANVDEYSPVVVKLTPSTNARLVGATEGQERSGARSAMDWPMYAEFVEDRVPSRAEKLAPGNWRVTVTSPLAPGDYAVVLRPDAKDKKFSGADVARNQGAGLLFNAAWPFAIR
jgi:hypothetical protein